MCSSSFLLGSRANSIQARPCCLWTYSCQGVQDESFVCSFWCEFAIQVILGRQGYLLGSCHCHCAAEPNLAVLSVGIPHRLPCLRGPYESRSFSACFLLTQRNKEDPKEGGYYYSTYKATVRRAGEFKSPTAGPVNFNEDLTGPMMNIVSMAWERIFRYDCQRTRGQKHGTSHQ